MHAATTSHRIDSRWAAARLVAALLVLAVVAASLLPPEAGIAIASENGPMETVQALLLFATAAGIWLFRRRGESALPTAALTTVLVAMGARELEWHKAWTGGNVLKLSFYIGPALPTAKLAGALVVGVFAFAAIYLLRRYARAVGLGLRRREPFALTVATFVAVLLVSRIVDKSLAFMEQYFGHTAGASLIASKLIVEEMLELALPMLVLLAASQRSQTRTTVHARLGAPYERGGRATDTAD